MTEEENHKDLLRSIDKKVTRIESALMGDDALKLEGIAQKVDRHDKHLSTIDKRNWMALGGVALISGVAWCWNIIKSVLS